MATRASHHARSREPEPPTDPDDVYSLIPTDPYADLLLAEATRIHDELRTDDAEWGWLE